MPNSDNTYGTFNKQTKIFSQIDDGSIPVVNFYNTDEAKAHFFTTEALAVWDETCTNLQWALVVDGNGNNTKLKVTFDFGTKGIPNINEADDWAGQYNSRKTTLINANSWVANGFTFESSTDHLF